MRCQGRWSAVAGLLALFLLAPSTVSTAEAQPCYRMICDANNKCATSQASTSGTCCCTQGCQVIENQVICACTASCTKSCAEACRGCPCPGPTAVEMFAYNETLHHRLLRENLLAAMVLSNVSGELSRPIHSQVVSGSSNAGERGSYGGNYGYKARIIVTGTNLRIAFIFERKDLESPIPPSPYQVELDSVGNITQRGLSADEVDAVKVAVQTCNQPGGQVASMVRERFAFTQ